MLNFDRYFVKHGNQNIQNDCHQWLSDSFRVRQIRFRPGLRTEPRWGSLQRSRRSPSWFKGKGGRAEISEKKRRGRERQGPAPLSQIPGFASALFALD